MYYNAKSLNPGGQKTIALQKDYTLYTESTGGGFSSYALSKKIPTQRQ